VSFNDLLQKYLAEIYTLAGKKSFVKIDSELLVTRLNLSRDEKNILWKKAITSGFIKGSMFGGVCLTFNGFEVASDYMERTYAEEERIVLETAIRLSKATDQRHIFWNKLEAELPKLSHDLRDIVNELEARGLFLHEIDEGVRVGPKGYEFVENQSNRASLNTTIFETHNHGPSINQIGGENNTQNAVLQVNPDFDKAITELTSLVKASSMPAHDIAEAIADLESITRLALAPKDEGIVKRAMAKIASLKTLVEVGGLAVQAAPQIEHLLKAFN
jgi:hypothetical protein